MQMRNILILVIDGLSKWYIDNAPEDAAFFNSIHKRGYSAENMFSGAPFTQGAIGSFWYGKDVLDGWGYLQENCYSGESIFDFFYGMSYEIYIGRLPPFYSSKMHATIQNPFRENPIPRAIDHLWRGRISYYLEIGINNLSERDWCVLRYLLKSFFEIYKEFSSILKNEYKEFLLDERKYTCDIVSNGEKSRFFQAVDTSMYQICSLKSVTEQRLALENPLKESELVFCRKLRLLNRSRMLEINREFYSLRSLDPVLAMPLNRCMVSNDDISSHLRNGYEKLPKIGEELEEFYEWYRQQNSEKPFFAYIHNFDFHYPEVFQNHRYGEEAYEKELAELTQRLDTMKQYPMSISKQLSLRYIDKNVEEFVRRLDESNFFEDSIFIITADHGISNYLYPVKRKPFERWNYIKTNFQIPFYVMGAENCGEEEGLHTAQEIMPMIKNCVGDGKKTCSIGFPQNSHISSNWVNGVPDFFRSPIRYGIRNYDVSMTIEMYATQFLISSNVQGLYHLNDDSSESQNMYIGKTQEEVLMFLKLLHPRWEKILKEYVLGEGECKVFESERKELIKKQMEFLLEYNQKFTFFKKENFFDLCNNKIVVCGDSRETIDFINELPTYVQVVKILGRRDRNKYMCGIPYQSIDMMVDALEGERIVIADRYEIEYVAHLNGIGYRDYILSTMLV